MSEIIRPDAELEDPTQLARCINSDCTAYRAGNTPFCAKHLREVQAQAGGIEEPWLEEKIRSVRTEDDDHPGEVKVYDEDHPEGVWVPAPEAPPPPPRLLSVAEARPEKTPPLEMAAMEPHWDGTQWVLRPKESGPDLGRIRSLVRELAAELGVDDA